MRVQSPIVGNMAGRSAGLIFQHYHGRTYGRSMPAIFHYGPTASQELTQKLYYAVFRQWKVVYSDMKRFVPKNMLKQVNAYNMLTKNIYKALGTFDDLVPDPHLKSFGIDIYKHIQVSPGSYTVVEESGKLIVNFNEIAVKSNIDSEPQICHLLYINPSKQQIDYANTQYQKKDIAFVIDDPDERKAIGEFVLYVAVSNDYFFSNFFV